MSSIFPGFQPFLPLKRHLLMVARQQINDSNFRASSLTRACAHSLLRASNPQHPQCSLRTSSRSIFLTDSLYLCVFLFVFWHDLEHGCAGGMLVIAHMTHELLKWGILMEVGGGYGWPSNTQCNFLNAVSSPRILSADMQPLHWDHLLAAKAYKKDTRAQLST